MRFYEVILFLFCFNLALSLFENLGIVPFKAQGLTFHVPTPQELQIQGGPIESLYYGNIFAAIVTFFKIVIDATVGVYPMLISLGVPAVVAAPISAIIYFLYSITFIQLIGKISLKGGE